MDPRFLEPNEYVDSNHPEVIAFARSVPDGRDQAETASRLFYEVRDLLRYNPWRVGLEKKDFTASGVLLRPRQEGGHCIDKALLLAAAARVKGIPARLHFANVRNHIGTGDLEKKLGTDLLVFHGYTGLFLDGKWLAAAPAFNRQLCEKLGVAPLEFDGKHDAIFQEYDGGKRFMEYVKDHGSYADVPYDVMLAEWKKHYPTLATEGWPLK